MTRWKKDETVFAVSVSSNGHTRSCRLPKPVLELLGDPDTVSFVVDGGDVRVVAGGGDAREDGGAE